MAKYIAESNEVDASERLNLWCLATWSQLAVDMTREGFWPKSAVNAVVRENSVVELITRTNYIRTLLPDKAVLVIVMHSWNLNNCYS